jgi:hypothetical protein
MAPRFIPEGRASVRRADKVGKNDDAAGGETPPAAIARLRTKGDYWVSEMWF